MKKRNVLVAAVLGISLLLAACGSSAGGGTKETATAGGNAAQASGEKVTVKVLQFKTELSDQMNAMAEDYMKEHPDVDLQIESVISHEYETLLKTRFASGEAPDIFNNEGYAKMDLWMDYLEDLSDQPWVGDMLDFTKDGISRDGSIYGLPLYLEGYGFLYNKDYFEAAGIAEVPTTLTALTEAVEKLEAAGYKVFAINGAEWYPNGTFLANIPMAQQGDTDQLIAGLNDGTQTIMDNELYKDWMNLVKLMKEHVIADPLTIDFSTVVSDFANGDVAMILGLNGYQPMIDEVDPEMNVGIMPMPINDDAELNDKIYASVSTYWCVNKNSASKDAAKEFLNWLVTSETGKRYLTEEFGFIPGLSTIEADAETVGPIGVGIQEYLAEGKAAGWEWTKYPDGVTTEFGGTIQKYFAGEVDEEGVLQEFQEKWDELKEN